jgi:hypothetical protein
LNRNKSNLFFFNKPSSLFSVWNGSASIDNNFFVPILCTSFQSEISFHGLWWKYESSTVLKMLIAFKDITF